MFIVYSVTSSCPSTGLHFAKHFIVMEQRDQWAKNSRDDWISSSKQASSVRKGPRDGNVLVVPKRVGQSVVQGTTVKNVKSLLVSTG